jgi:DNA polymerase-3 subunit epsilon
MVANAPSFETIAPKVATILKGKIFVAHNVNFDYSFIKSHLESTGYFYHEKKLCTVRLSRQIFPGQWSYSLGNLCNSLKIPLYNRHRAGGDALATVALFNKLLKADTNGFINKSFERTSKEQVLPPHVPVSDFIRLPNHPGVYYFYNQKGKVVYVGKALNIRKRVNSHFSNNSDSRQKQNFIKHIHSISYQTCATELMACILESSEIKKLWPVFNYSQKRREDLFGIYAYTDQNGYLRLAIEKSRKHLVALCQFHYLVEGYAIMRNLVKNYQLCDVLCSMQKSSGACGGLEHHTCKGACNKNESPVEYNERVLEAIQSLSAKPSFIIVEESFDKQEQACILVKEGKFYGMGNVPLGQDPTDSKVLKKLY